MDDQSKKEKASSESLAMLEALKEGWFEALDKEHQDLIRHQCQEAIALASLVQFAIASCFFGGNDKESVRKATRGVMAEAEKLSKEVPLMIKRINSALEDFWKVLDSKDVDVGEEPTSPTGRILN